MKNLLFLFFLSFSIHLVAQDQPNIILIITDDAGYADFSFQSDKFIQTPNIDRIAKEGAIFTNAYVSAAVCSPSRAGLLTGVNQPEFGHVTNYVRGVKYSVPQEEYGIPNNVKLMGEYLQPHGYRTAAFGKWHEGFAKQYQPNYKGFDHFWGFLWGSSHYFSEKGVDVLENGNSVESSTIPYMTDAITNESIKFIDNNKEQPFFLYVSYNAVHSPLQAKPEHHAVFKDQFPDNEKRAILAAMTYSLDENIGKLFKKLEQTNKLDNTIIFFINDNGGSKHITANNFPLRGYKGSLNEGGIRVPMAVRWPNQINAGTICNTTTSSLDLLPTMLAANNLSKGNLKGFSVLDLINKKEEFKNRELYWRVGQNRGALRHGNWKYILEDGKAELYNLADDIAEETDLSEAEPVVLQQLSTKYTKWFNSLPPAYFYPISGGNTWNLEGLERGN